MKRGLCIILILLFLAAFLLLIPSATLAEIISIPIDKDPKLGACDSCYIYEENAADPVGYEDPSISVRISRGVYHNTSYVAARVKINSVTQLRSAFSGRFGTESAVLGTSLAKSMNAVFAVNGDYYTSKNGHGYLTRQGHQYRKKCKSEYDILVIDYHGDLHILQKPDNEALDAYIATLDDVDPAIVNGLDTSDKNFDSKVYQSFSFGPGLVIDGVQYKGFTEKTHSGISAERPAQRMAIAQVGPLEYLFVASSSPEDYKLDGSVGLTLDEFSDLVYSFGGIINAYNLDGGSSSTMVFRTTKGKFGKMNSNRNSARFLADIIYFASAWEPDGTAE